MTTAYAQKIHALLAKAASTTHEAERTAFTEAAERLMVKWGIDEAMLDATKPHETGRPAIVGRRYQVEGTSAVLLAEMASVVAAGVAPVRTLFAKVQGYWWAVGYTDDLARVELYVPHVVTQARIAWKTYLRTVSLDPSALRRARVTFLMEYGRTVKGRFDELFQREVANVEGAALVLARREGDVDAELAVLHPKVRVVAARRTLDFDAAQAGRRAGLEASLTAGAIGDTEVGAA